MNNLNRKNTGLENKLPIKIIQFGEGNFFRVLYHWPYNNRTNINNKKLNTLIINMLGNYNVVPRGIEPLFHG